MPYAQLKIILVNICFQTITSTIVAIFSNNIDIFIAVQVEQQLYILGKVHDLCF